METRTLWLIIDFFSILDWNINFSQSLNLVSKQWSSVFDVGSNGKTMREHTLHQLSFSTTINSILKTLRTISRYVQVVHGQSGQSVVVSQKFNVDFEVHYKQNIGKNKDVICINCTLMCTKTNMDLHRVPDSVLDYLTMLCMKPKNEIQLAICYMDWNNDERYPAAGTRNGCTHIHKLQMIWNWGKYSAVILHLICNCKNSEAVNLEWNLQ